MHGCREAGGDPNVDQVQLALRSGNSRGWARGKEPERMNMKLEVKEAFPSPPDAEEHCSSEASDNALCDALQLSLCALRLHLQWHAGVLSANDAMTALDRAVGRISAGRGDRRVEVEARRQWSAPWGDDSENLASE
jgi:hypothetical protein